MTALLVTAAFLTLAVCGFAAFTAVKITRERRTWRRERRVRPTIIQGEADTEVSDVAACLQVWLDERWNERFG